MSESNHTRVSVIVPAFNMAAFLPETLESVLGQSLSDWQCIVVDDGSTDGTAEVVGAFTRRDSRISLIRQTNGGLSAARNAGIRAASGAYIQLLDADDLVEAEKLAQQVAFLEANPSVSIAYGPARYFYDGEVRRLYLRRGPKGRTASESWMPGISGSGQRLVERLCSGSIMAVNCAIVRVSVFKSVGLFDQELRAREDWDFWLRCARAGHEFSFLNLPDTCALVRAHAESMSNNLIGMLNCNLKVIDKHSDVEWHSAKSIIRRMRAKWICERAIALSFSARPKVVIRELFRAFSFDPDIRFLVYAFAAVISTSLCQRIHADGFRIRRKRSRSESSST